MTFSAIEFVEAGTGDPVICLHGIGGGLASFAPQMSLPGVRVIALNMPGYGRSVPLDPLTFETLSERLATFITALGVGPVHLVGQSIGGMLALEHAVRAPEQVATLSLIGTTPSFGGRDDSFKDAFLKARLAPLVAGKTMAEIAEAAAPNLVGPSATPDILEAIAAPMRAVSEATWRAILRCLVTFNRRDELGDILIPTCLIAGGYDQNAPARTMEKMAAKMPNATYHLIEGAGHMINQEAPEATNKILTAFLKDHAL